MTQSKCFNLAEKEKFKLLNIWGQHYMTHRRKVLNAEAQFIPVDVCLG